MPLIDFAVLILTQGIISVRQMTKLKIYHPLIRNGSGWNHFNASLGMSFTDSIHLQYIQRNMHTAFALLCFVVFIHWLIFPYPSGLLHWHCGNLTIAPVPAKQPWWIWINTSCEFIMNGCITTTKQSTTKPCAYFLGCTVAPAAVIRGNKAQLHTLNIIDQLFDILKLRRHLEGDDSKCH